MGVKSTFSVEMSISTNIMDSRKDNSSVKIKEQSKRKTGI